MDPRTPVLVGAGRVTQHEDDPARAAEAVELMVRATEAAVADTGVGRAVERVALVLVPEGIWSYPDPARLVARRFGLEARTVLGGVGVLQQTLLSHAATQIASGAVDAALVVGGEAKDRARRAAHRGTPAPETAQDGEPDECWRPTDDILAPVEIERDLAVPANQYAVIESALRHADRLSATAQRQRLGRLAERFGAVAAADPLAWDRSAPSAAAVTEPDAANRMVASPYTRLLCSQWNVDQAAAVLLMSAAEAERLGIARDRWVFPLAAAASDATIPLVARAELHRSPGTALAGAAALGHAGLAIDDVAHLDLYSCFPAAVQVQARELGRGPGARPHRLRGDDVRGRAPQQRRHRGPGRHGGRPAGRPRLHRAGHLGQRHAHQTRPRALVHRRAGAGRSATSTSPTRRWPPPPRDPSTPTPPARPRWWVPPWSTSGASRRERWPSPSWPTGGAPWWSTPTRGAPPSGSSRTWWATGSPSPPPVSGPEPPRHRFGARRLTSSGQPTLTERS